MLRTRDEILKKLNLAKARKIRNFKKGDEAGYQTACALQKILIWFLNDEVPEKKKKNG